MATTFAIPNELTLKKYIGRSVIFHFLVFVMLFGAAYFERRGVAWGGVGGPLGSGVRVNLVSAAGIPMPKEKAITESKAVDPTKGLYKEEPKPKVPEPKTDAMKIPKFEKEKPLPPSRPSRTLENKTPPPDNAVPYGKGGNPDLPTGYSQTPGGGSSGVTVQGQGGGDFATRYGWYIEAARRRVGPNWNVLMLDPAVRNSTTLHSVIAFTITRDGSIKNLRIAQSSGNSSWDYSGLRAIQSSAPFPPLPSDWTGGDVAVLWDFPERDNP
jgi:TonB family protein